MAAKFIVKYVRDKFGSPIGCVVAINRDIIGCCYLNKIDRPKSRKELLNLALARAEDRKKGMWKVTDDDKVYKEHNGEIWLVPGCMRKIYREMIERSHRYFKVDK